MVEGGSSLCLTLKARLAVGAAGGLFRKDFDGNRTIEAQVPGFVHDAHAALAQLFEDLKVGETAAW